MGWSISSSLATSLTKPWPLLATVLTRLCSAAPQERAPLMNLLVTGDPLKELSFLSSTFSARSRPMSMFSLKAEAALVILLLRPSGVRVGVACS